MIIGNTFRNDAHSEIDENIAPLLHHVDLYQLFSRPTKTGT